MGGREPGALRMSPAQRQDHRRAVTLLSLAAFASAASARLCDPMLPELARSFAASPGDAAHVVSGFAVTYGLLQMFFGPLGDRLGKYRLIALTTIASTLGSLGAALAVSLDWLVVARVLSGATAAGIIPLAMAWIGDTVAYEERQATLARFLGGQILGVIGGQFIGGLFVDTLGWRWAFVGLGGLYLVVGLAVLREARVNPALVRQASTSVARGISAQVCLVLRTPWARRVLLTVFLEGMVLFGALAFVPSYLHAHFALRLSLAGLVMGLFGLGGLLYIVNAKTLVRRLGEFGLALLGGALIALAWGMLALGETWLWALPGCAFAGLGYYMLHNTLQTNATQMVPAARGTAVSLFASAFFLGQSLGVVAAASVMERAGSLALFGLAALLMPLVATTFAYMLKRQQALTAASTG